MAKDKAGSILFAAFTENTGYERLSRKYMEQ